MNGDPRCPAPFGVTVTHLDDSVTVLAVRGEVDLSTSPRLNGTANDVLAEHPAASLIVDLTEVTFLSSSGINVLIDSHARASQRGKFAVVADGRHTERPLTLLGLNDTFAIHRDLAAAIESVHTEPT